MLIDDYDAVFCDLDGVVYQGPDAIMGAPEAVGELKAHGRPVLFITNNASRTPDAVSDHLSSLGMPTEVSDVVSSAQAAAHLLAADHPAGSAVLTIGGAGLIAALEHEGLRPVFSADDAPVAVVQGFSPDIGWKHLAEASFAVRDGIPWTATNTDSTIPVARGIAPGNGTLVDVVRTATGMEPRVAGKPQPAIFRTAADRIGAKRPVMVGDRLDTDILGANRAGIDSLLVLTGVNGLADVLTAPEDQRPTHVADSIAGLLQTASPVESAENECRCGKARARLVDGVLELEGEGAELVRAVTALVWPEIDAGRASGLDLRAADS